MIRILLTGESAAGHLSPIIAVYESIKKITEKSNKKVDFMLISSRSHFLREMFEETGVVYKVVRTPKYKKSFPMQSMIDFFKYVISFLQAVVYVFNYMPDVIFSKGGHASLPVVLAGWIFHIPVLIHESDAVARPIDKFMFRFAKKITISFENTKDIYNSKKTLFTGHPVRSFIVEGDKEKAIESFDIDRKKRVILFMAGSEGAEKINNLIMSILPTLLKKYEIVHQCGIGNYDKVRSVVERMNIPNLDSYHLFPFFKRRIADAYAVCDLVVSRAGANTVSEIMTVGKPSILIPLASAVSDKQTKNAFYYYERGASVLVSEKNLRPNLIINTINEIFKNSLKTIEMRKAAKQMSHPEASRKIAEEIIKLAK